jgi:hypothetical protein
MEVLRFDSRNPSARYAPVVDSLRSHITTLPVFCPKEAPANGKNAKLFSNLLQGFAQPHAVPAFSHA